MSESARRFPLSGALSRLVVLAFVASLAAADAQTPPPSTAGAAFDGTYRLVSSARVNQTFMTRKAQVGQCPDRRPGPLTVRTLPRASAQEARRSERALRAAGAPS